LVKLRQRKEQMHAVKWFNQNKFLVDLEFGK